MASESQPRVVIADDHPLVLKAAADILDEKFQVEAVTSGTAAVEAAGRLDPDVVVLDVAMPGLDGFQTAASLRASGSRARIVFLSNHAGDDFVLAAVSRGASGFVDKIRMQTDLVAAVEHAHADRMFVPTTRVLRQWDRTAGRRHDLLVYSTDTFFIEAAVDLFDTALDAGDSIVAIMTEPHRRALQARCRERRLDIESLLVGGRCSMIDAHAALESILVNGMPDSALFDAAMQPLLKNALAASTAAPPYVTIFGEIAPILWSRGEFDAGHRLEAMSDRYFAPLPVTLLCAYPVACFPADPGAQLVPLCARHSTIVASERQLF